MDWDLLSLMAPIEWVGDRLLLADIKPRHIGRVVTFDWIYEGEVRRVIGTLVGAEGDEFNVNGMLYSYEEMQNIKIWRRVIRK